jgi:hypothetical protein
MSDAVRLPFQIVHSARLGLLRRPVIPAALSGPKGTYEGLFLLDSGADVSLIPFSFGQLLGLSTEGAPRGACCGIGRGALEYCLCAVDLQIREIRLRIRVGWCEADGLPVLLGRLDVFDKLDIEFRQSSNYMILRPATVPK